jgi:hypothetical protein
MLRHAFAGAAAFALIAGAGLAHAQDTTDKQTTVIQNPDGSQTVNKSKIDRSMDDDGNQHMERHDKATTTDAFGHKNVTEQNSESNRDSDGSSHQESTTDTHHDD